jgi:hypothetical protein|tara:strand:+ start:857 stop:1096 length:240 start_codon:yes stop_codon:yes gene_type:complete
MSKIKFMDSGNIISLFKRFDIWRLIWSGILLRIFTAIVDGIFSLGIREIPNYNYYIFALALAYTLLWMFNKSYIEEDEE